MAAMRRRKAKPLPRRTPPQLIQVLTRFPIVSAELVTRKAPCSPMSARRNLNPFTQRGLAREITGQGRYRFRTADL